MTLTEFKNKYMGAFIDFDAHYGTQCVDLVRQYIKDVLMLPQPEPGNAVDWYLKHNQRPIQQQYFNCFSYGHGNKPLIGSIAIFSGNTVNKDGHIGVVIEANDNGMLLFEQDGMKHSCAHTKGWDYSRLLGWLVPK